MFLYEPRMKIASIFLVAELRLFDKNDNLIRAIPLEEFTHKGISSIVQDLGFYRKSALKETFPFTYRNGVVSPPGGITFEDLISDTFRLCEKYERRSKFLNENATC